MIQINLFSFHVCEMWLDFYYHSRSKVLYIYIYYNWSINLNDGWGSYTPTFMVWLQIESWHDEWGRWIFFDDSWNLNWDVKYDCGYILRLVIVDMWSFESFVVWLQWKSMSSRYLSFSEEIFDNIFVVWIGLLNTLNVPFQLDKKFCCYTCIFFPICTFMFN